MLTACQFCQATHTRSEIELDTEGSSLLCFVTGQKPSLGCRKRSQYSGKQADACKPDGLLRLAQIAHAAPRMPKKQRVAKVCSASSCGLRLRWSLQLPKLTSHCLIQGQAEPEAAVATAAAEPAAPAAKEAASAAAAAPQVRTQSSCYVKRRIVHKHATTFVLLHCVCIHCASIHGTSLQLHWYRFPQLICCVVVQEAPVEAAQAAPAPQAEQKITPAQLRAVIASGQQVDLPGFTPCACPHVLLGAR